MKSQSDKDENVFQRFKLVLANTGLIQMLSHYQQATNENTGVVLGYRSFTPEFTAANGKTRVTLSLSLISI